MALRAIAQRLPKIIRPVLARRGTAFSALVADWAAAVGPQFAHLTLPEKLSGGPPGEGGVLTVRIAGAAAVELQHAALQTVERINGFLGYRAVARLRLVQAPLPGSEARGARRSQRLRVDSRKLEIMAAAIQDIAEPELRTALERLAIALAQSEDPTSTQ